MMQSAAFILNIANAMPMVAVTAGCAVIVGIGDGGLPFEHVHGMVEHHRHDAGNLGHQKKPEKPRAEAALREQQSQRIPLDLDVPVKLGTLSRTAKPASCVLFGFVAAEPQDVQAVAGGKVDISARSARGCAWILVGNEPLTSLLACRPTAYINVV
jgi:hypothetical protein